MSRVLAEGFDALFAAGLRDLFGDDITEIGGGPVGVALRLDRSLPDVVLLNSTSVLLPGVVNRIVSWHPSVTVIACSANEPVMQVYPPFHRGESYRTTLAPAEIRRYLQS